MTRRHLDDSSVVDRGLYWIPTVVVAVSGNVGIDRRWRQETSPTTPMQSCRASRTLLPTVGAASSLGAIATWAASAQRRPKIGRGAAGRIQKPKIRRWGPFLSVSEKHAPAVPAGGRGGGWKSISFPASAGGQVEMSTVHVCTSTALCDKTIALK